MQEVTAVREIRAPREDVVAALTPRAIVEHAGTYRVEEVERTGDGWTVVAGTADLEVVLEFTETERGFVYQQRPDAGPFEEMYASVSVAGDGPVDVTMRSCFTFGHPFAWLVDRLAARERRTELRRALEGLAGAVGER